MVVLVVGSGVYQTKFPAQGRAGPVPSEGAVLDGLVDLGIDDLAKFRIVEFFHRNPRLAGDAATCAAQLGLHSVAQTATLLEQLAAAGLLSRLPGEGPHGVYFRLAQDETVARRLGQLLCLAWAAPYADRLFRVLALRSLARARALGKANKGQGRTSEEWAARLLATAV